MFPPRPGWDDVVALLDPHGSLELVAWPLQRKPSARYGCVLLLRHRTVLHGTFNFIKALGLSRLSNVQISFANWIWRHCALQSFTTLCGVHECCGMLTTTKCSTPGARHSMTKSLKYGLREKQRSGKQDIVVSVSRSAQCHCLHGVH